jgi:WD40 repeat protein
MSEIIYEAFISYRHKEMDTAAAKAFQRQLETYRVPSYIAKRSGRKRMGKVFRDQDELPLMADLGEGIRKALDASEWLIVICTPDLPQSKWCMAEVDYFIETGRRGRILTVLVSGEPEQSFPPQLRFITNADGTVTEQEPLAADIRAETKAKMLRKVRSEKLRILAPLLGVGYDDLRRRARERKMKTALAVSAAAAVFFALFGGYALNQASVITRQYTALLENRSRIYAGFAMNEFANGNRAGAGLLALAALPPGPDTPVTQAARDAVYTAAYGRTKGETVIPLMHVPGGNVVVSPDGKTFVARDTAYTRLYDARTFRLIYEHPGTSNIIQVYDIDGITGGSQNHNQNNFNTALYNKSGGIVLFTNGSPVFIDTRTGEVIKEGIITNTDELADFGFSQHLFRGRFCAEENRSWTEILNMGNGEAFEINRRNDAEGIIPIHSVIFSPDNKYASMFFDDYLMLYDLGRKEIIGEMQVPEDGMGMNGKFSTFTPDSRYLMFTRGGFSNSTPPDIGVTQVLEIPSLRVMLEAEINTANFNMLNPRFATPTCRNAVSLYSGPNLLLPNGEHRHGVYDIENGALLHTLGNSSGIARTGITGYNDGGLFFASFSPSGRLLLTIHTEGRALLVRDVETGDVLAEMLDHDNTFDRGFILADDGAVVVSGKNADGDFCAVYALRLRYKCVSDGDVAFHDGSGRYIRQTAVGENVRIIHTRDNNAPIELEDSGFRLWSWLLAGSGNTVAGMNLVSNTLDSFISVWDAETGEKLMDYPRPEPFHWNTDVSTRLNLSPDGLRLTAIHKNVSVSGFTTFYARTGEVIAEGLYGQPFSHNGDVTKFLYIDGRFNHVFVVDALTGEELIRISGFPEVTFSGLTAAISEDGGLLAVYHNLKRELELYCVETGTRLYGIPFSGAAANTPIFSHDGSRLLIGIGEHLYSVNTATGKILFAVYGEGGFGSDYVYSADDGYIVGADIRCAQSGEIVSAVVFAPQWEWEAAGAAGTRIPMGNSRIIYLPSFEEAVAELNGHIRDYAFTRSRLLRYALD